jgi:hypothetical protein
MVGVVSKMVGVHSKVVGVYRTSLYVFAIVNAENRSTFQNRSSVSSVSNALKQSNRPHQGAAL